MKKPELLAPAGDFEKMKTAIHYGADAVYLGNSGFSLRSKAGNFGGGVPGKSQTLRGAEELRAAAAYAREKGVRVYVTVNVFPHNKDLPAIREHIEVLRDIGPDAVIVSDPGVFAEFKKTAPAIPIHVSTQANITNVAAARFWEDYGAKRLVLSRELSLTEIEEIRKGVSVELEVFVHGSICISYSGRCYISSFLTSRGANRGECTNSCRWNYALLEEKRPGEYFPVFEDSRGTYLMSSKDLCMLPYLNLLVDAGVDGFKIEGRMKGINYVAGVVKVYREAIDSIGGGGDYGVKKSWTDELSMFSSRGYTTGMFFGKQPDTDYNFDGESYRMSHELVGVAMEVNGGSAKIALRNRLDKGDDIEYLTPGLEGQHFAVESMFDDEGVAITTARNEDIVTMNVPPGVRRHDLVRRKLTRQQPSSCSL